MIQALAEQGIDTPEKLGQFFTNAGALLGQIKDLQDQLQVLQESKKTDASLDQDGKIQEDGKEIQALRTEVQARLKLFQVEELYRQDLKDLDDLNVALRQKIEQGETAALRQKNQELDLKLSRIEERHFQDLKDLSDRHHQNIKYLIEGIISGIDRGLKAQQKETYDQNEFNNAAMAWIRNQGLKLNKDQVMTDPKGFLMGYGDHIHGYIAQRKLQGVQPYIAPDNYYVVPNTLSEDYLVWARQNVPQQSAPLRPDASGKRPNTGF